MCFDARNLAGEKLPHVDGFNGVLQQLVELVEGNHADFAAVQCNGLGGMDAATKGIKPQDISHRVKSDDFALSIRQWQTGLEKTRLHGINPGLRIVGMKEAFAALQLDPLLANHRKKCSKRRGQCQGKTHLAQCALGASRLRRRGFGIARRRCLVSHVDRSFVVARKTNGGEMPESNDHSIENAPGEQCGCWSFGLTIIRGGHCNPVHEWRSSADVRSERPWPSATCRFAVRPSTIHRHDRSSPQAWF